MIRPAPTPFSPTQNGLFRMAPKPRLPPQTGARTPQLLPAIISVNLAQGRAPAGGLG